MSRIFFFVNVWRKNIFDIYVTEYGTALTTILPILLLYLNDKISQQPENCENRNDPDLVQAFLKKWWVESDIKAPNLPLSLRFKGSGQEHLSSSPHSRVLVGFVFFVDP
jgi:hypothetical protein